MNPDYPHPLPTLNPEDRALLATFLDAGEDLTLAAERSGRDLVDLLAFTNSPAIALYLDAFRQANCRRREELVLTTLESLLKSAPNPVEQRRIATAILRACRPARNHAPSQRTSSSKAPQSRISAHATGAAKLDHNHSPASSHTAHASTLSPAPAGAAPASSSAPLNPPPNPASSVASQPQSPFAELNALAELMQNAPDPQTRLRAAVAVYRRTSRALRSTRADPHSSPHDFIPPEALAAADGDDNPELEFDAEIDAEAMFANAAFPRAPSSHFPPDDPESAPHPASDRTDSTAAHDAVIAASERPDAQHAIHTPAAALDTS